MKKTPLFRGTRVNAESISLFLKLLFGAVLLILSTSVTYAQDNLIFSNRNTGTVRNMKLPSFTINTPTLITRINTYHWNNGKGKSKPGKIGLKGVGKWKAQGLPGATTDLRDSINLAHAYSVAIKTARHLAYEKLAETVGGINLYGDATYDRELMLDSNLKIVVTGMIRGARVINAKKSRFSDGSIWVEVTLGMKLYGEDGLISPSADWQAHQTVEPISVKEPVSSEPTVPMESPKEKFTGLIIDATGFDARPAMFPKIITSGGRIIYGTGEIDKKFLIQWGLMGYQSVISSAKNLARVGKNPLVIKAIGISGKSKADFVISDKDASRILAVVVNNDFLKECRVVVVLR